MKNSIFLLLCLAALALAVSSWQQGASKPVSEDTDVWHLLQSLGDAPYPHQPDPNVQGASWEQGLEIVTKGHTTAPDGKKSKRVSPHFVCTSCHNVERDEPDLLQSDPLARLHYAREKKLPFLQGSALYGIVDRSSFYNGDYVKKYGDLVKPARNDLRQAIHLCATECAQGRPLEPWEMESVLSYLFTIGLKIVDLNLSDQEWQSIQAAVRGEGNREQAIALVRSKYLSGMPASFLEPPAGRGKGVAPAGDADTGRILYEQSCLHCHLQKRYSFLNLDSSKESLKFLDRHFTRYSRYSVYQVARYGTQPLPGKRAYMPNYTREKMSEQMLEDLRAYLRQASQ
jgi:mono/diheme cytochrome c family protein